MRQVEVHDVVEERHPADHRQPLGHRRPPPVEPRQQQQHRTDGHQQELQRRRILGRAQERQQRHHWSGLRAPRARVAVDVGGAHDDEARDERQPAPEQQPPAGGRLEIVEPAGREPQRHQPRPRQHRVSRHHRQPGHHDDAGRVEQIPQRRPGTEAGRRQRVEQVVEEDHGEAGRDDRLARQVDESRQHDHRQPERHQDDEQQGILAAEAEVQREAHHSELEQHEPQAARRQVPGQAGHRSAAAQPLRRGDAGQEHEARRTDMGDPAGQEQQRRRPRQVLGLEEHGVGVEELADVVERHDHHRQAAHGVDAGYARLVPRHGRVMLRIPPRDVENRPAAPTSR